jgi:alpha-amylase
MKQGFCQNCFCLKSSGEKEAEKLGYPIQIAGERVIVLPIGQIRIITWKIRINPMLGMLRFFSSFAVMVLLCSGWSHQALASTAPDASIKTIATDPKFGPRVEARVSPSAVRRSHPLRTTHQDWSNEVIYFLLIDRFHDGDPSNNKSGNPNSHVLWDGKEQTRQHLKTYQGGDLAGVIEKLDYLKGLGVTALWLSPVYDNAAKDFSGWWPYHGYHPVNFYQVEDHFGDLALMRKLVDAAHERGMKVMLDMIYNHVGPEHAFVMDQSKWKDQGFAKWFHPHSGKDDSTSIKNWEDQKELENLEVMGLPDLDQDNPYAYEWLLDISKYWVMETGADAFRLDAVKHVAPSFWQKFSKDMKKWAGADFFLLGEVFSGDANYLAKYKDLGFDGLFDIPLYYTIRQTVGQGSSLLVLSEQILKNQTLYGNAFQPALLIDNHDLVRFSHMAPDRVAERIKLALTLIHTLNGIPVLYYGTEVALAGAPDKDPTTGEGLDYMNRRMMPWPEVKAQESNPEGIIAHIKALTNLRKGKDQYGKGRLIELYKDATTYVYAKAGTKDLSLVAINASVETRTVEVPSRYQLFNDKTPFKTLLGQAPASAVQGDKLRLVLAPYSSSVLEAPLPAGFALDAKADPAVAATEYLTADFVKTKFSYAAAAPAPSTVSLVGDFNAWKPDAHPMTLDQKSGQWQITVPLKAGRYLYKFLVNGKDWLPDPKQPEFEPDPYGGKNSVLVVKEVPQVQL